MKFYAFLFIIIWISIIMFPKLIWYIFGGFLIFLGLNMFFLSKLTSNFKAWFWAKNWGKKDSWDYVKFGSYKIFK